MNSLGFIIRHDHHDAMTDTHSLFNLLFLLARYFHLLLQSFGNEVRKNFMKKTRHGLISPFYKGLDVKIRQGQNVYSLATNLQLMNAQNPIPWYIQLFSISEGTCSGL